MKKGTIAILLLVFTFNAIAQVKRETISKSKIGNLDCQYTKAIDIDNGVTRTYIFIGFQNKEYSSITDIKSIYINVSSDSSIAFEFVKDLKMALSEMGKKSDISWNKKQYAIALYNISNDLFLKTAKSDGTGYTTLSKNNVEQLINWIESIGFKENSLPK